MSLTKLKTRLADFLSMFLGKFNGAIVSIWNAQHFPLSAMIQDHHAELNVLDILVQHLLHKNQQANVPFQFVQIGANDGDCVDPVRKLIEKYTLKGILVEPLPTVFEALKKNYATQPQLIFENAAIGETDGSLPFYYLEGGARDASLFSSFDRDFVSGAQKESWPETTICSIQVPVLSPMSLLAKHNIESLSLLIIDAEGWDYKILKAWDFSKTKPSIIEFEHNNLSFEDQTNCYNLLIKNGYRLLRMVPTDTIAFLDTP